jgi:hypothetical protein
MRLIDFIMFSGARFPDSCNGTSNPIQQLTVIVLADLWSHQPPNIATFGYFIWETRPWRQEKQHKISQVSDEYRHRQSETVSVKTAYGPDVLTVAQYCDVARIRWCNIIWGLNLQKWRRVRISDESRFMLQKRDGRTCVYRRRNERFATNCVLEVDNFDVGSVMIRCTISYARKTQMVSISGKLNAVRYSYEVLTPHMLPAMNLRREGFKHTAQ